MMLLAVFSHCCQRSISDFSAKIGNFFSLKSNVQVLPSDALKIVNNVKESEGRDMNGKLYQHVESIIKEIPGFKNFK